MSENEFSILIATDNHLGYMERDPVRGDDSFASFEEILRLALERNVDFILLGGDMFHDNRPSRKTLHTTFSLIRKYCYGDRSVSFDVVSNWSDNFPAGFETPNFMDRNLNISMPIFSIHGNHDDPSGDGNLCTLDMFSVTGQINYFGKAPDADNITIQPVLLTKGTTKLALYGLGNVRDERLHRTFLRKRVKLVRPEQDSDNFFNIFIIHQNRVPHGEKNHIPEEFLDRSMDLILWGHEHECLIDASYNPTNEFWITQPGSSVATSLSDGESKTKHVGILTIRNEKDFRIEKIRLKTVRPFIMDEVVLKDVSFLRPTDLKGVNDFLVDKVSELIEKAIREWEDLNTGDANVDLTKPPKPLIRLKVEYSGGFDTFNPHRFGQRFVDQVANPKDILHFYRRRAAHRVGEGKKEKVQADIVDVELLEKMENINVEDLVEEYLNAQKTLEALPESHFSHAVHQFVEKDDKDAIKEFVDETVKGTVDKLASEKCPAEEHAIKERILQEKEERSKLRPDVKKSSKKGRKKADSDDEMSDDVPVSRPSSASTSRSVTAKKRNPRAPSPIPISEDDFEMASDQTDVEMVPPTQPTKGKGKAKAKPTSTSSRRAKTQKQVSESEDDDDDGNDNENDEEVELPPPRKRAAPAKKSAPRKKAALPKGQTTLNFKSAAREESESRWPPRRK